MDDDVQAVLGGLVV